MTKSESGSRVEELLAGRALGELSREEELELSRLLREADAEQLNEEFDRALAVLELAVMKPDGESMPPGLRARVQAEAFSHFERVRGDTRNSGTPATTTGANVVELSDAPVRVQPKPRHVGAWALAAGVALVGLGWSLRSTVTSTPTAASPHVEAEQVWQGRPGDGPHAATGGSVRFWADGGELTIRGLRSPPFGRYHVWVMHSGVQAESRLAAVFDVSGVDEARVRLRATGRAAAPRGAFVTLQREGESPRPDLQAVVLWADRE